jgi:hypothetical protein
MTLANENMKWGWLNGMGLALGGVVPVWKKSASGYLALSNSSAELKKLADSWRLLRVAEISMSMIWL